MFIVVSAFFGNKLSARHWYVLVEKAEKINNNDDGPVIAMISAFIAKFLTLVFFNSFDFRLGT